MSNKPETTTFDRTLQRYEQALEGIENKASNLTNEQVIDILIARDALQELIENDVE